MSEIITYSYRQSSSLHHTAQTPQLLLSAYSEVEKSQLSCFFQGVIRESYMLSRCLLVLSNVVKSSFNLSPFQLALLKDPIVTAGNQQLRFEGFSHCAGVYARVDVMPGALDGVFPASGTVNVDFNQPMLNALAAVGRNDALLLSVGEKEIAVQTSPAENIIERKVPLPVKWIKGLTSVQLLLAAAGEVHTFNKMQALQLFQSIPNGQPKADYYLVTRGNKPLFSPVNTSKGICIGGIHRLKLLEPLLPLADQLRVFADPDMQATTWQLYFGQVRFSLSLSRECWRGFSGEGAALESLLADIPDSLLAAMDKYSYANQAFNTTLLAVTENMSFKQADSLTGRMAAMGLLGYDPDARHYFYRRLPYKPSRILQLNPRMKEAEQLLAEDKVMLLSTADEKIEARVAGSQVWHTVVIDQGKARCTCTWFAKHQGERGACKHILAVKKKSDSRF
ncbi:SWIM zinc finger family protein [Chitinophaga nivalis]|uniref:SWIM zinc finger family protein n=1 Tax=Chitinophaga nivalis TaxID=2991709 RepID=A0ABT3IHW5_9BACT|nr:SWIM zinc finger family protein [Chitinophaga nivalis]MCW3466753.1 SWIM zinc finger family protein [Chitinophaga nivalis]MCW3483556.1 SWIM zinc finger family protein [Chitinophaga nivalis]